jgi:hypothetical protein
MNPNQTTQPAKDSQIGLQAESSISNTNQYNPVVLSATGVPPLSGRESVQASEVSARPTPDGNTSAPGSSVTVSPVSQQPNSTPATSAVDSVLASGSAPAQVTPSPASQQPRLTPANSATSGVSSSASAPSQVTPARASLQQNPGSAVSSNWCLAMKNKFYAIHHSSSLGAASGFRKIGVTEDVVGEASKGEAKRLTDELMKDIENYGLKRARNTKVTTEKIMVQLTIIASSVNPTGQRGPGASGVGLDTKMYNILLENVMAAATKFVKLGITEKNARIAAEAEAVRLTKKLTDEVERYGVARSQKAKVSVDRILRQFAIIAGVRKEASAKQTEPKAKK